MPLFLLLLLSTFAQADFSAELDQGLQELEANGLQFIGNQYYPEQQKTYLADIRRQAAKIKVKTLPQLKKPEGASRYSGFFHPASNTIYVSQEITNHSSLHALALHETLGVLGIPDQDYEISVVLSMLLHLQRTAQSDFTREISKAAQRYLQSGLIAGRIELNLKYNRIFNQDPNTANQELALAPGQGGGTLVGGGGDLKSLVIKENFAIKVLTQWHERWKKGRFGKEADEPRTDFFTGLIRRLAKDIRVEPWGCDRAEIFYAETDDGLGGYSTIFVQFPSAAKPQKVVEDMFWYWQDRIDGERTKAEWHPHSKDPAVSLTKAYRAILNSCK
jgi:hypothetical protein